MNQGESVHKRSYTLDDLSEALDVSTTAILHWIDEGRLGGVQRATCSLIPGDVLFKHRDGRTEPIGCIVDRYKVQPGRSFADDDEIALLSQEIARLEKRHGVRLNVTIEDPDSSELESDFSRWRFYRARLRELLNGQK